jgi:hypothetical protein
MKLRRVPRLFSFRSRSRLTKNWGQYVKRWPWFAKNACWQQGYHSGELWRQRTGGAPLLVAGTRSVEGGFMKKNCVVFFLVKYHRSLGECPKKVDPQIRAEGLKWEYAISRYQQATIGYPMGGV